MVKPRTPIVAILGHVDHGKTTLLDYIRKSKITEKEYGGITQKIGAYEVKTGIRGYKTDKITFIDTPGHEAFTKLRSRGANVADIAILIIDAKDSVMPQTVESIYHIKSAEIPFIVALNKIDLPDANPEKVKNDLMKYDVLMESKGGKIPAVEISAKTGKGVNDLLEMILFIASDLNLTFNDQNPPFGYIIETKKDKRGVVATVILKDGSLKVGDIIYSADKKAKVRSMINDLGQQINEVYPSTPFELLGFEQMPTVGDKISDKLQSIKTEETGNYLIEKKIDLNTLFVKPNQQKKLNLIIKADSQGSLEAIDYALKDNKNIEIVLKSVGEITKSDIFLAKTTKAIIIGFSVSINQEAKELAQQEKIIIKTYNIIYELIEELNEVALMLKEKEEREKNLKGEAKILATFIIEGEKVFGVKITKGKINLNDILEIYRNNKLIGKTKLVSLKIRAKKVDEVKKDQEAGMIFSPALDISVGDVVKSIL
ncbi:MAG: translation initiation factor IF-2 [Microgenomates group bacterium]